METVQVLAPEAEAEEEEVVVVAGEVVVAAGAQEVWLSPPLGYSKSSLCCRSHQP